MSAESDDFRQKQHELFAGYPQSWHDAIDAGHDMTLVAEAMTRTFEQRIYDLDRALRQARALREGLKREQSGHPGTDSASG